MLVSVFIFSFFLFFIEMSIIRSSLRDLLLNRTIRIIINYEQFMAIFTTSNCITIAYGRSKMEEIAGKM